MGVRCRFESRDTSMHCKLFVNSAPRAMGQTLVLLYCVLSAIAGMLVAMTLIGSRPDDAGVSQMTSTAAIASTCFAPCLICLVVWAVVRRTAAVFELSRNTIAWRQGARIQSFPARAILSIDSAFSSCAQVVVEVADGVNSKHFLSASPWPFSAVNERLKNLLLRIARRAKTNLADAKPPVSDS